MNSDTAMTQQVLFASGRDGFHTFRIPALIMARNGEVLAFAEGRHSSRHDFGDIDLVMRRSRDGGQTWSDLTVVGDLGPDTYGNPAPVVDTEGTVHLLTTGNRAGDAKHAIRDGEGEIRRVYHQRSDDHGHTWTPPREITEQVVPPDEDWRWYATGPGHAICLQRGPYAGRLVVPCDHSDHTFAPDARQHHTDAAHVIYSDDRGQTWHVGGQIHSACDDFRPWESTAVELVDGRIYLNARNEAEQPRPRVAAWSADGGQTLGPPELVAELIEPTKWVSTQACVLRYSAVDWGDPQNRILFSNPASEQARERLTVRSSFDEARTWTAGRVVCHGPSGYSDMARLPDGSVGLLYETGDEAYHERLVFARFTTEWLDA